MNEILAGQGRVRDLGANRCTCYLFNNPHPQKRGKKIKLI